MLSISPPPQTPVNDCEGIAAEQYQGMTILRPMQGKVRRRVLYLNSYGMAVAWRLFREGNYPGQHLWGCLELIRMGYEIAMPEEPNRNARFFNYRRQDRKHVQFARNWLGRDGIVYSAHTVTFWLPLLRTLRLLQCPVTTLLYARGENLRFAKGYDGVIAMTPAAGDRAQELAPHARHAYLSWGVDLTFFPYVDYAPKWFLSCGKTRRDFRTLAAAATACSLPMRVINPDLDSGIHWPGNVQMVTGRPRTSDWYSASFQELVHEHYAGCSAALVLLEEDSKERFAAGFTQMLEAMALGRPVIVTRTGAIARELDVEKEGCGLFVPPNDSAAVARAMEIIMNDSKRAQALGLAGRKLCQTRYNILRYGNDLHHFFESL